MPESIFEMQAELCKTMGHPARLQIVRSLQAGPQRVSDVARTTGLMQALVSKHLAALRACGIVSSQRRGREIIYRITSPKIVRMCDLMREMLAQQAAERAEVARALREVDASNG